RQYRLPDGLRPDPHRGAAAGAPRALPRQREEGQRALLSGSRRGYGPAPRAQQEDRPHRRLSADGGAARDPGLARDRRQRFQGDGQGAPEAGRPDDADSITAHRRALQQVRTPARRRRKTEMQQAQTFAAKNWRDLIRPKALEVDKETLTGTYGKFF